MIYIEHHESDRQSRALCATEFYLQQIADTSAIPQTRQIIDSGSPPAACAPAAAYISRSQTVRQASTLAIAERSRLVSTISVKL